MHDDSLYALARDPRVAKLLRDSLRRLADGPAGPLQEMAQGVLRGELDLRQAAMSDVYGAELGSAFGRFWAEYEQMDRQQRDELIRRTEGHLDGLLDDPKHWHRPE